MFTTFSIIFRNNYQEQDDHAMDGFIKKIPLFNNRKVGPW